jgi:hypothetical protein
MDKTAIQMTLTGRKGELLRVVTVGGIVLNQSERRSSMG